MKKKNEFDDEFYDEPFEDSLEEQEKEEPVKPVPIELPHIVNLDFPIQWGKDEPPREIVTIKRRLQTKDVMSIPSENLKLGHMVKLVSKVTCEPMAFIEQLDTIDLFKCIEVVKNFLPVSQKTGKL